MNTHVRIDHDGGRTLACKRATTPAGVDRVRAEAALLAHLDHPGVIRFVELRETDRGPELVSDYVGPRTLATCGRLPLDRVGRLVADLAGTVADLHARGVVHGAVRAEHAIVAGDRVVLCGFAATGGHEPPDDVHGVGTILRSLLDPDVEEEPIPDRRPWRRRPWTGFRHRALLTLADQATAEEARQRPAARALAHAVQEATGSVPTEGAADGDGAPGALRAVVDLVVVRARHLHPFRGRDRAGRPARRAVALGAIGVAVLAVGVVGVADRPGATPGPARAAPAPTIPTPSSTTTAPPTTVPPPTPACAEVAGPAADVDGDGCPEPVRQGPGWVEVAGTRYRVGRPGNAVVLGDWDCDGTDTVALLQRGTAEVWRFTHWDPTGRLTAEPAGRFAGAVDLDRQPGSSCDVLVVHHRDGRTTEVEPG